MTKLRDYEKVVIIVCGAGVTPRSPGRIRAEAAYKLWKVYHDKREIYIVSTGYTHPVSKKSEAEFCKEVLTRKGVPEERVYTVESFDLLTNLYNSEKFTRDELMLWSDAVRLPIVSHTMKKRTETVCQHVYGELVPWRIHGVDDGYYNERREKLWDLAYRLLLLGTKPGDLQSLESRVKLWERTAGRGRSLLLRILANL